MAIYEPIIPNPSWPSAYTFSPAVRVGDIVYLSGSTATDDRGQIVGVGDIVEQTRQIFRKFETILKAVGGGLENIVDTTDYFLSLEDYRKTADVRREVFRGPPWPAATGVIVKGLVRPDALIEIKATAVLTE